MPATTPEGLEWAMSGPFVIQIRYPNSLFTTACPASLDRV